MPPQRLDTRIALHFIENAADIIYIHDLDGTFTYANAAVEPLMGFRREELIGKNLRHLIAPESQDRVFQILQKKVAGESVQDPFPVELVARDGRRILVDVSARVVQKNGRIIGVQGIARDVTESRHAERALRESEEKFRALAETAASAIFIYSGATFRYVNTASAAITGYSRQELLAMNFWDIVHPDFREFVRRRGMERQQGADTPSRYEFKIITRSGEERWLDFSASTIAYEGTRAALGTAFDVTDRKRANEDLLLEKALLEQLFDCAPEGIVVQSNDGRVLRANIEFCRMFGYDIGEVIGSLLDDLIAVGDERPEATALSRHVAAGGSFNVESVRHRKDGTRVDVSILGTPIQVEGGQVGVYVIYRDITERKRAEQALVESESKFRAVSDTAASAISIHTSNRFLYVNAASQAISGYTRDELMQMSPLDLVHPEFRAMLDGRTEARAAGDSVPSRYEFRIVTKSGEERWLDLSASRLRFGGENATVAVAFDITERKRAEQLQAALYRIANCGNTLQDLPALYCAIHGIVSELVYARNFYIALYDDKTDLISFPYFVDEEDPNWPSPKNPGRGLTEYVLRTGQPLLATPEVFDALLEAGEVVSIGAPSIDWLGVPLKTGTRTIGAIVVQSYSDAHRYGAREQEILTFVSQYVASAIEHKRDQEAVKESEGRYRSLFERAAYGIVRTTADGRILDANPAMAGMLGYGSSEELIGLDGKHDVYSDPEDRDRILRDYHTTNRTDFETRWKRKDGKIINIKLSGRQALNSRNEPDGYELIVQNITEHRALEEQLRHAQKMEAIGRLAGGVAHDFNNLLTVVKGYSELLLDQLMEADPMRTQVDEIRKAADRAATLTRQLLAFSRRQVLAPKVLDLNAEIGNMEKLLGRLLGEDVQLVQSLATDLGRVKADPGQIEQVLMNLAVNARDAMPKGGHVSLETANLELAGDYMREQAVVKAGRYVTLSFTDDGCGMPEEVRSRVFEPFFTTKERGTGLGLSTVYGIVKQSGGFVWVDTEVGRGTTFRVYLPRVDDEPEQTTASGLTVSHRGSETVLLVEDDDGVRPLIRQMLQRYGYRVLETGNAGEALLACERHEGKIDLLLTDVVLNQMSGSELAERLASVRSGMRVLYVSGYTEDAIVKQGVLKPGIAFLQKPFTAEALTAKVRAVLRGED